VNWRLLAWWTTAAALATWVTLHFALLLVVQVPWPVISPEARRAAMMYSDPLFRQSWWLFAPNPPAFDRAVYVRGTSLAGGDGTYGEAGETPWLALTEPVVRAIQEDRLSVRDADLTVLLHGMYSLSEVALAEMGPAAREELFATWRELAHQPAALIALERAGSAALVAAHPDFDLRQVQVRLTLRRLPPFADRARPVGEPEVDVVFPPVPVQDVAAWSPGP
jgi:hypothetical protein